MADEFELQVELRTGTGKSVSRRLRRNADMVPAILYGAGVEPQTLSIAHKDMHKACENEAFFSHIISLKTSETTQQAILKDLQRHPSRDRILHADFFRIQMDKSITVEVPLHFTNEDVCIGVKQEGGNIAHTMTSVEVSCLPGDLPEFIEVDIGNLAIGDSVHMSELELLEGLSIPVLLQGADHDQVVVAVNAPRRPEEIVQEGTEETAEEPDEDSDEDDDS